MIVRCVGWKRRDGTKIHRDVRVLRKRAPHNDGQVSDGLCKECAAILNAELDQQHEVVVYAQDGQRLAKRYGFLEAVARLSFVLREIQPHGFAFLGVR